MLICLSSLEFVLIYSTVNPWHVNRNAASVITKKPGTSSSGEPSSPHVAVADSVVQTQVPKSVKSSVNPSNGFDADKSQHLGKNSNNSAIDTESTSAKSVVVNGAIPEKHTTQESHKNKNSSESSEGDTPKTRK